uniref:5-HT6 n=1 Tax=Sinonovacula constricta TaxID=98310 RepID=A0AA95ZA31_SINCO|nr:5-HT6 [Sinonovacula constricta]
MSSYSISSNFTNFDNGSDNFLDNVTSYNNETLATLTSLIEKASVGDPNRKVPLSSIAIGFVLFLISFLTIVGNLLVFTAVMLQKKLQTVSNTFIVSLCMADLLLGTVVMIPATLNEIFDQWIMAEEFCVIWAGFDVMLCSASILNVCLISLDRYIAIMSPLRYKVIVTYKRAFLMLGATWGLAITASFLPLSTGIHNPDLPALTNLTIFSKEPKCLFIPNLVYVIIASTVTILLPIVVAFVLYYRVSKEAKRQACFVGVLITPSSMLLGTKIATKHIREPFTRKATITLGIIVGAYVVTWAPFLVANLTEAICRCVPSRFFIATVWLGYCNSLINPIIYPFFMRDFRSVYKDAFLSVCPCVKMFIKGKKDKIFSRDVIKFSPSTKKHCTNTSDKI